GFEPPVVTRSVSGVAEPPSPRTAIAITAATLFYAGQLRGYFTPDGDAALPEAHAFTIDRWKVALPGPHPLLAHAVCAGATCLDALRVAQCVKRVDVSFDYGKWELLQRFRVPEEVTLGWVEVVLSQYYFGPAGMPSGPPAPPPVIGIVDGADPSLP